MLIKKMLVVIFCLIIPMKVFATCIGLNCTCSASVATFNVGTYAPFSGNAISNNANVSVTCSALVAGLNVSYAVSLNKGSSNSYTTRTMKFSSWNLNYNIYTTSTRTTVWGDGTSGTGTISDSYSLSLLSTTRTYPMYAYIPASQNVGAGTYTDSITATVTF